MNTQLLPLLNPAGNLTCAKAMEIAKEILTDSDKEWSYLTTDLKRSRIERKALALLQSYEALLQKKLSKKIVLELFEGFKDTAKYYAETPGIGIDFATDSEDRTMIDVFGENSLRAEIELPSEATIGDLFTEIERYNRKAKGLSDLNLHPHVGKLPPWDENYNSERDYVSVEEIERYNRTATSKIELKFTPNILKELGL